MPAFADLNWQAGCDIGVSEWKRVQQDRIDRFALATDDLQFVHLDQDRAARETPFGGTIAHGFLTLSLISAFAVEAFPPCHDIRATIVAGVDKIRFTAPVKVESRVRGVFRLLRMNWLALDQCLVKIEVEIQIEGETKPALSGELTWILHVTQEHAATFGDQLVA